MIPADGAGGEAMERTRELVEALRDPACYSHPTERIRVVETHISWVLLTGPFAYKLRKPLRLPFLDFTDPEARRLDCVTELRLNRRLAPELYDRVVRVTGTLDAPRVDGDGPVIDHAVRMVEFPARARLDRALADGIIETAHMERLAADLAAFHARAAAAPADSLYGGVDAVRGQCLDNFAAVSRVALGDAERERLEKLQAWTEDAIDEHGDAIEQRRTTDCVRECHGDLHLENIALVGDRPVPFDCLEFDTALRFVDPLSEVAFLVMDLEVRGRVDLAWSFLDAYLERSGDYRALGLLRLYLVYRAMVRAKIDAILLGQGRSRASARSMLDRHLDLAERYASTPRRGPLIITHGLSGAGKSWLSGRLLAPLRAVRVRSDVERRRLDTGGPRYAAVATRRTYERLEETARAVLKAGFPVILDATFLDFEGRARLRTLARSCAVDFRILSVHAPPPLLEARVIHRRAADNDPSEATPEVIEIQRAKAEPLTAEERDAALVIDTSRDVDVDAVIAELARGPRPRLGAARPQSRGTEPSAL